MYDAKADTWLQSGKDIPVKFAEGDRFTASVTPEGVLEIYQNGNLLIQEKLGSISRQTVSLASTPQPPVGNAPVISQINASFQPVAYRHSGAYSPDLPEPVLSPIARFTLLNSAFQQQTSSLTIDYTYDPLNRLASAAYSDGRSFNYTYDPAGNVLELEQNLGPGTVTTVYTYDAANQLDTAQQGSTTWQYTYDANGSLISDGVKTYTYDSANRLIEVSDQSTVTSLSYNGLGQRLSMDAAGVIAYYVLDGNQPLTATSAGNITFYLYGLGTIGEKTNQWAYSLPDGTNTPRQLSGLSGEITLAARYTPWGDTLEIYGTGNFTFGYLGGVLDAATGLLYVGNGQYYDPSTGRFLTRDVNPNSPNPYVPWNPIGAILGPLALVSLFYTRKKKAGKAETFFVMLLMAGGVAMTLVACGPQPIPTVVPQLTPVPADNNPPTDPNPNPSQEPESTQTQESSPTAPPAPTNTPLIDGDCGIPLARYDYPCSASGDYTCIDPNRDEAYLQIAHTIYGEGGNYGGKVAANILQTVINRAYTYWVYTHHAGINPDNIPWSQINKEKLTNLILFILSEPGGDGWPSYNAWRAPEPRYGPYWQPVVDAVQFLLDHPGAEPSAAVQVNGEWPAAEIRSNTNVQFYGASRMPNSVDPNWRPPISVVHTDIIYRYGVECFRQYYGTEFINPPDEVLDCPA